MIFYNDIGALNCLDDETEKIQQKKAHHNCIYTSNNCGDCFSGDDHFDGVWSAIYIRKMSGNLVFEKIAKASVGVNKLSNMSEELFGNDTYKENIFSEYEGYCIILDAGHGGSDGGTLAEGITSGDNWHINAVEKDINLAVVLQMKTLLEELGIEVVLTRDADKSISLDERVEIANSVGFLCQRSIRKPWQRN